MIFKLIGLVITILTSLEINFVLTYPECVESYLGSQIVDNCEGFFELWGVSYFAEEIIDLNLQSSNLEGNIPPEIGEFYNLVSLNLSSNNLNGHIPTELGSLANLQYLNLSYNQLEGEIPSDIANLLELRELKLHKNYFSGVIPSSIGLLSNLEYLNLYDNQLTGLIPNEIMELSNLEDLILHINNLSGQIPSQIGNLSSIKNLYLNDNNLNGPIPIEISYLDNLEKIRFQNNQLTGLIPTEICGLAMDWWDSRYFNINNNNLCPPYPSCMEDNIGNQDTTGCGQLDIKNSLIPLKFEILSTYPNPFNSNLKVKFRLNQPGRVSVLLFDMNGRLLRSSINRFYNRGDHFYDMQFQDYSSGIYIIKVKSLNTSIEKKSNSNQIKVIT